MYDAVLKKFRKIEFLFSKDIIKKLKLGVFWANKNFTIEDISNSLKITNQNNIIEIFSI